jgi:BirA family biotin operon repressor/biotin-[acetyl-CoA-carboxylase] ligase
MAGDAQNSPPRLPALGTRWLGRACEWLEVCASTNDVAAARGRSGAGEGLVVVADMQTAGRGRLGRAWHSPAAENVYLSLLLRPHRPPAEIPPLTLLAGAAVARALEGMGVRASLKWPNDVLVEANDEGAPRKLAGILTEMASEGERVGHVVVGIGLNVNTLDFPPDIAARATSLRLVAGHFFDRASVVAAILDSFEPLYDDFVARGPAVAVTAWRDHAALGERCRVTAAGAALEGVAVGLDPDGALLLRDDAGRVHRVLSGEILP